MLLQTYQQFVNKVNELGFITLSNVVKDFPSLTALTAKEQWHTDDLNTDPWKWKDRVAKEQKLAYGCIINGHKGFISKDFYSVFYGLFHPHKTMQSRWNNGEVNQMTYDLYQLFSNNKSYSTSEIRKALSVTKKNGGSTLDNSIKQLQKEFYITVVGNKRKLNKQGEPYGWPSAEFNTIENHIDRDWLKINEQLSKQDYSELILNRALQIGNNVSKAELTKKFALL